MKEKEGAPRHTNQPERTESQLGPRYRVDRYGTSRNFAAYEGQTLIAVTLYRKGAAEITMRLAEKDHRIEALERELTNLSQSQLSPLPSSAEPLPDLLWRPPRQLDLIAAEQMSAYRITAPRRRPPRSNRRS